MARIDTFKPAKMERNTVHDSVTATYAVFEATDGGKYLRIDTYGSPGREITGKKSQSVQFSPAGLAELRALLASL
jgi:hypothetical protein